MPLVQLNHEIVQEFVARLGTSPKTVRNVVNSQTGSVSAVSPATILTSLCVLDFIARCPSFASSQKRLGAARNVRDRSSLAIWTCRSQPPPPRPAWRRGGFPVGGCPSDNCPIPFPGLTRINAGRDGGDIACFRFRRRRSSGHQEKHAD